MAWTAGAGILMDQEIQAVAAKAKQTHAAFIAAAGVAVALLQWTFCAHGMTVCAAGL